MNIRNVQNNRTKYFYAVLFLNDYYPKVSETATIPETKVFDITANSNSVSVKWLNDTTLYVRHNLQLPLTLEMWNAKGEPIFYCPILKSDIDSLSVGEIAIESSTAIIMNFTNVAKPVGSEVFKLAMKSLPTFDLKQEAFVSPDLPTDIKACSTQQGLAIVFRRHSLDALFDLIAEFDETYWHSMEETYDLQYLTQESCYKDCFFASKYTSELQDILDMIDVSKYNVKYSWENARIKEQNSRYL
jgi:hypothetical protein